MSQIEIPSRETGPEAPEQPTGHSNTENPAAVANTGINQVEPQEKPQERETPPLQPEQPKNKENSGILILFSLKNSQILMKKFSRLRKKSDLTQKSFKKMLKVSKLKNKSNMISNLEQQKELTAHRQPLSEVQYTWG